MVRDLHVEHARNTGEIHDEHSGLTETLEFGLFDERHTLLGMHITGISGPFRIKTLHKKT
jgi:hypothetical protein